MEEEFSDDNNLTDSDNSVGEESGMGNNITGNTIGDRNVRSKSPFHRQETFDRGLPCEHSYLGSDLTLLRGRTFMDEGSVQTLFLLPHDDIDSMILIPGQTLPLTVSDQIAIAMLRRCVLSTNRTFGVIPNWRTSRTVEEAEYGTTVEIYEYHAEGAAIGFRIKAKARQRFKLIEFRREKEGYYSARVLILPEVSLPDSLTGVRLESLNRHRSSDKQRCLDKDAMVTAWPGWVYDQYRVSNLITKVEKELVTLTKVCPGQKMSVPKDPTELSFWVAQNLPLTDSQRLVVLRLNSPIQRLRWELSVLKRCQRIVCRHCANEIGKKRDVFPMSLEGPQGTYVNSAGYLHETLTLFKAKGMNLIGQPSTEFSWFPGYAWVIAECTHCHRHMGWLFTATQKGLTPASFWGLSRRSLSTSIDMASEELGTHVI